MNMIQWPVILGVGGALAGGLLFLKIVADELRFWDRVLELKKQHIKRQQWPVSVGDSKPIDSQSRQA